MNFDTIGGRKFLLVASTQVLSFVLIWFGKIDGGVYSAVIIATVAAYVTANVAQRKVEAAPPP